MNGTYFDSAEVSDVGKKRKNNEDACLRLPEHGIYCVADGMGGQAGGDLASEAITTSLKQVFTQASPDKSTSLSSRIDLFKKAANQASNWIKTFSDEKVIGQMGSTVVALVIDPRSPTRAASLHAGDSRLYRLRKEELKQLTTDHSTIEALAAKLGRSPESLPAKYQNELLRAVGLAESVELESTPLDVISDDAYLLCSDGLTKMLSDEQIAKILKEGAAGPITSVVQTLINAANEAGGRDNVTVVLVRVGDLSNAPKAMVAAGEAGDTADLDEPATTEAPTVILSRSQSPSSQEAAAAPGQAFPAGDAHSDTTQTDPGGGTR